MCFAASYISLAIVLEYANAFAIVVESCAASVLSYKSVFFFLICFSID